MDHCEAFGGSRTKVGHRERRAALRARPQRLEPQDKLRARDQCFQSEFSKLSHLKWVETGKAKRLTKTGICGMSLMICRWDPKAAPMPAASIWRASLMHRPFDPTATNGQPHSNRFHGKIVFADWWPLALNMGRISISARRRCRRHRERGSFAAGSFPITGSGVEPRGRQEFLPGFSELSPCGP